MKTPFSNNKKRWLIGALAVAALLGFLAWKNIYSKPIPPLEEGAALALEWHRFALEAERFTEGYRAPVAARMYAYADLAGYEAALPGLSGGYRSMAADFPGLLLPKPEESGDFSMPAAMNACYSFIFQRFFLTAPGWVDQHREELALKWQERLVKNYDAATLQRSADFGKKIAEAVYAWSESDSIGHLAHLHNYDRNYVCSKQSGTWQPCADFPTPALLPHWGETRTFYVPAQEFLAKPLPPYSTDPNSPYYKEALEILTMHSPLSAENRWIAEFWSDDTAGLTFSSAGRWISIANQVIEREAPPTGKVLETYFKIGLALSDATVSCWFSKYKYDLERPETFIRKVFKGDWRPLVHTPPFPSYPSGHSMESAAAAEILTQLYGENYSMIDRSHKGRKEFRSEPRSFHSFHEMVMENAFSRIPLGVHFRMDCEEGTRLGQLIGRKIVAVQMRVGS